MAEQKIERALNPPQTPRLRVKPFDFFSGCFRPRFQKLVQRVEAA